MKQLITSFFQTSAEHRSPLNNERALQLELALHLRAAGAKVEFETKCPIVPRAGSTHPSKSNCDLFIRLHDEPVAIELKVALAGRHPETLFDFCNDIAFIEGIVRAKIATRGICLFVTNDRTFWQDSGRGTPIHNLFRLPGSVLSGVIQKPTGTRATSIEIEGRYAAADGWRPVGDSQLLEGGRYLLLEINP